MLDEAVIERVLDCRPSRTSPEEVLVKHKGSLHDFTPFVAHHEERRLQMYICK